MTNFNHSPRTLAKGRWLLGVSVVAYVSLSLVIGFGPAALLIAVAAALTVLFWLCARFPLLGIVLMGFIGGLTGTRGYYRPWFAYGPAAGRRRRR